MIAEFEDFCLWMYVVIDELWWRLPPTDKPGGGPPPTGSDSEMITLAVVGECRGWTTETSLLGAWGAYPHLFPVLPERSRFNRRRRRLAPAINAIRQGILAVRDVVPDRQCAIDSLPVPVLAFHSVPSADGAATWRATEADFGKVPTKKQTIFGDKSSISAPLAHELRDKGAVTLLTIPRRNRHRTTPAAVARMLNGVHQIIETVNHQLTARFGLARHQAHTFPGLCARLHTKLAAHTLCSYSGTPTSSNSSGSRSRTSTRAE